MTVYTVSELNRAIRELLQDHVIAVRGEVSNMRITRNQLVFFELKDAQSYVTCFLMAFHLEQKIKDGMEIQVVGTPSLFLKSGSFHIAVRTIEVMGSGDLQRQFELLKRKLESEGLFSESRKRTIPAFPETIGLITSKDGAAVTDVVRVLRNRWPIAAVKLYPVGVQGEQAIPGILRAFQWMATHAKEIDTVILTRGGGSLSDLWAFNSEALCRAVFSCPIPVIAGIGHERDQTLVELVADQRASTPSNAAEIATPTISDVAYYISTQQEQMIGAVRRLCFDAKQWFRDLLDRLELTIRTPLQRMNNAVHQFHISTNTFQSRITQDRLRVDHFLKLLQSLSPTHILDRGYSITRDAHGNVLKRADRIPSGEHIRTQLAMGVLSSTVD